MLDIYILTRLAIAEGICETIFALGVFYWIVVGAIAVFRAIDDELHECLLPVSCKLRKAVPIVATLMSLSFLGCILLPDKSDVGLMVGDKAVSNVAAAIEAK